MCAAVRISIPSREQKSKAMGSRNSASLSDIMSNLSLKSSDDTCMSSLRMREKAGTFTPIKSRGRRRHSAIISCSGINLLEGKEEHDGVIAPLPLPPPVSRIQGDGAHDARMKDVLKSFPLSKPLLRTVSMRGSFSTKKDRSCCMRMKACSGEEMEEKDGPVSCVNSFSFNSCEQTAFRKPSSENPTSNRHQLGAFRDGRFECHRVRNNSFSIPASMNNQVEEGCNKRKCLPHLESYSKQKLFRKGSFS